MELLGYVYSLESGMKEFFLLVEVHVFSLGREESMAGSQLILEKNLTVFFASLLRIRLIKKDIHKSLAVCLSRYAADNSHSQAIQRLQQATTLLSQRE